VARKGSEWAASWLEKEVIGQHGFIHAFFRCHAVGMTGTQFRYVVSPVDIID